MQLSLPFLVAAASMLQPVLANFDIYMVDAYERVFKSHQRGYQIFEAQPSSCDEVRRRHIFWASGDVSGDKTGVRCTGSGCDYTLPAGNIEQLEMNFHGSSPTWHWSKSDYTAGPELTLTISPAIYKDRGFSMYGCKFMRGLIEMGLC